MTPDVGKFLSPDGVYIVSGIIEERAEEVTDVLKAHGFTVISEKTENGWYCAASVRKS